MKTLQFRRCCKDGGNCSKIADWDQSATWIRDVDVQNSQGVSASEITYIVSG